MEALFVKLLQLSLPSGALVLAVIGLRLVLRRAPRWTFCLLWGLVALRLICPVSLESGLAWMPAGLGNGTLVEEWTDDYVGATAIVHDTAPNYDAAAAVGSDPIPAGEGGTYVVTNGEGSGPPDTVESAVVPVLSRIWAAGVIGMALYALVSTLGLRRRLTTATRRDAGIRQSEWVPSPFVLGLLRPTIYLPYDIQEADLPHVLAHERAHIRRGDPWWKALGFALLAVYWFHPLVWVAYALACRDMEAACDEAVVRELDREGRRAYAGALLRCSLPRRSWVCPLAFGEIGVKERVRHVMDYKKPARWILLVAGAACVLVAIGALTVPKPAASQEDWRPLEELQEGYSSPEAAADGCVVLDGTALTAGEEPWCDFVAASRAGQPGAVRVYQTYSGRDERYFLKELRYDGAVYTLTFYDAYDDGKPFLSQQEYRYLIHSPYTPGQACLDTYLLSDDPEASTERYYSAMLSSALPDQEALRLGRSHVIYSCLLGQEDYERAFYGTAYADLNGDGRRERYCLGLGPTSGLFTFTLCVYDRETLIAQGTFPTGLTDLCFVQGSGTALQIQATDPDLPSDQSLYDVSLRDGEVTLTEDGQVLEPWG